MPSSNARLTLKQLGLSVAQIQTRSTFRRQRAMAVNHPDQAFMRFGPANHRRAGTGAATRRGPRY